MTRVSPDGFDFDQWTVTYSYQGIELQCPRCDAPVEPPPPASSDGWHSVGELRRAALTHWNAAQPRFT